jgi:L-2,4-diaminobutyric acid acetyltransferase
MLKEKQNLKFTVRNVKINDIKQVYRLLVANKPLVGLNSRYTYFLLARDFFDTCIVAEHDGNIVAFSSGYVPPRRKDTFFNWETVVQRDYRGSGLQKRLLLEQIKMANATYLEATVNPSNEASNRGFTKLAEVLGAECENRLLFSEEDFENDGHEAEVLYRIGPISKDNLEKQLGHI